MQSMWEKAVAPSSTAAEAYLRRRGITCTIPPSIRFIPRIRHTEMGLWCSAMIALATHPHLGPAGVHLTYLDGDRKAPVDPVKRMIGKVSGASVHLGDVEDGGPLIITEGIETGLALMTMTGFPVWAAMSAWGMKSLVPSMRPALTIIAADNDRAGTAAARTLEARLTQLGLPSHVELPPTGMDFADVLAKRTGACAPAS